MAFGLWCRVTKCQALGERFNAAVSSLFHIMEHAHVIISCCHVISLSGSPLPEATPSDSNFYTDRYIYSLWWCTQRRLMWGSTNEMLRVWWHTWMVIAWLTVGIYTPWAQIRYRAGFLSHAWLFQSNVSDVIRRVILIYSAESLH